MSAAPAPDRRRRALALAITGAAVFMVTLDNLVVTNALPSIRADLGASISQLGWFVNAYTLTFAALLLTGASLGDRFGRRRVFATRARRSSPAGSLWAALATSSGMLIAARGTQGLGAALVMPLSLTLLSAAFPAERRGLAIGIWSGLSGLAVALGPVVGGAVVDGLSWQWIFFLNVPIGIVLAPLAYRVLDESHGRDGAPRRARARAREHRAVRTRVGHRARQRPGLDVARDRRRARAASSLLGAFVAWERRAPAPMLPLRLFRSRAFSATNGVSLIMNFGIFGSIFLLAQFLQTVQGYSAFDAGVRTLPWTLMPMFIAPLAGVYSDRIGSRPLMATGLALQAIALGWLASVASPTVAYSSLIPPFILAGIGMALVFAPVSNMILSSVRRERRGQGQRRQQRDPRGRRRARRGRARERVPSRGQRAHRPGLRRRPRARRLDRSRRARRGRAARARRARARRAGGARRGDEAGARPRRARAGDQRIVSTNGALATAAARAGPGAQRELAGVHDRERGREAPGRRRRAPGRRGASRSP